ncbi:MAG: magnesium transporter [Candidatus Eisenbacteria bacterium]|nr:magnesium transporter [Candidatus Eisenbacteria bacterium]
MQPLAQLILPEVRSLLERGDVEELRDTLEHLHPADIANLIEQVDDEPARTLFLACSLDQRVDIFEHLEENQQERMLGIIGAKGIIPIVEEMASDDRADFLQSLPKKLADALVQELSQAEQRDVAALVKYPEKTAGAIMTSEVATVPVDTTVADALAHLRKVAPHREMIYYIYVTDQHGHLLGVLSLKDLVLAEPGADVKEIMKPDVISLPVDTDQEIVANELARYDFLAMPILDERGRIVGIVTHDDVIDVFEEETTEDAHMMGAVAPLEETYIHARFWEVFRKRGLWLTLLFFAMMFSGTALRHYEDMVVAVPALVIFIPLIISTGGNAGSQSATLVIRALAVGDVELRDWAQVMWREFRTGISLGVLMGLVGVARALLWNTSGGVALVVGFTLVGIVLWGAVVGGLLPLGLRRVGLDPAIASSPFVASVVDVSGIIFYFSIAQIIAL